MKMNALSCMIIYLPCFVVIFKATIYKILFWQNVGHFEHVEPTTIYTTKRFHLHTTESLLFYKEFSSLYVTTTLLLKAIEES